MSGFLNELGKKIAERWLTLLVLPGLFYLTCLAIALTLRHPHALEPGPLRDAVNRLAVQPAAGSPGVLLLTATAILAAAAAAGFAAGGLGRLTERAWNAEGHRWPARLLTRRRQQRWKDADAEVQARIAAAVRARTGPSAAGPAVPAMAVVSAAPDVPAVPAMSAVPGKPAVSVVPAFCRTRHARLPASLSCLPDPYPASRRRSPHGRRSA